MKTHGYEWLIFGLLLWVAVMNGWWWIASLTTWTLLFTLILTFLKGASTRDLPPND